ncbi:MULTISPECIES: class I SAM-dependent methyltransferase [Bacillaceae]|uniref:Class I SAM-dependent methyltransferase n=1 Tax=Evansella alkalicola TaxID=745819 RepID=A0ABS6JTD4_9BACI|nr:MULTISPECIES: class I SAM-dependent methyltransferase [Bacillaceae]MBU9721336.1 class I SAM-dependent methyltransferase [Bacillus alkalicola]
MLDYTGERVIPEQMKPDNGLLLEHCARYYFASSHVHGRVLDIACGAGYGSKMLLDYSVNKVTEVVGADIDEKAIAYANIHYLNPKMTFTTADVMDKNLKSKINTFDSIVSFETIEHVKDDRYFIKQMLSLLNPKGTLILSTPFGEGRDYPSKWPYHYFQLTQEEFKALFNDFSTVEFYFQNGVMFEPPQESRHYPLGVAIATK